VAKHPFHLVSPSPWPLVVANFLLISFIGFVAYIHLFLLFPFLLSLLGLLGGVFFWFWSIILEGTFLGFHTHRVRTGLRLGFILFIISEVFFFVSFFWAYLHFALSPAVEIGSLWPPLGIVVPQYWSLPFLNTCLLLVSGSTLTCAHFFLISGSMSSCSSYLLLTLFLGSVFLGVQLIEFFLCSFTISDSAYGSAFFLATGFHGLHVFVGTAILLVALARLFSGHFTRSRHFGLEFRIWYWHFVDVIWLLLYLIFYVWGT